MVSVDVVWRPSTRIDKSALFLPLTLTGALVRDVVGKSVERVS